MAEDKGFGEFRDDGSPRPGHSGPVRGVKPFRMKEVTVDEFHHGKVVLAALTHYLAQIRKEHLLMRICQERDLTVDERQQLSEHMRQVSREELADHIDSWGSLRIQIEDWIEAFSFEKDPNAPPRVRSLSKLS